MLEDAKAKLRHEILSRLDEAKGKGDHRTVLRFTRLYAPLGLKVLMLFTQHAHIKQWQAYAWCIAVNFSGP